MIDRSGLRLETQEENTGSSPAKGTALTDGAALSHAVYVLQHSAMAALIEQVARKLKPGTS